MLTAQRTPFFTELFLGAGNFRLHSESSVAIFASLTSGRSVVWLARLLRVQEVGSSNLPAPTNFFNKYAVLTKFYPQSIMWADENRHIY